MVAKTVLCAAVLLLCVASHYAMPRLGCRCVRTTSQPICLSSVRRIEVLPVSGYCRRTEIRITRRSNRVVCVKPDEPWVQQMLEDAQSMNRSQPSFDRPNCRTEKGRLLL